MRSFQSQNQTLKRNLKQVSAFDGKIRPFCSTLKNSLDLFLQGSLKFAAKDGGQGSKPGSDQGGSHPGKLPAPAAQAPDNEEGQ